MNRPKLRPVDGTARPALADVRKPPCLSSTLDPEMSVVSSLLFAPSEAIAATIDAEIFAIDDIENPNLRVVADAIVKMHRASEHIDVLTLVENLTLAGRIASVGGARFLGEVADYATTVATVANHARIVRRQAAPIFSTLLTRKIHEEVSFLN
ncbi:MAG: hypothetical protein GY937_26505 [bacterium]|nr:hypothetical protein [bacterium]